MGIMAEEWVETAGFETLKDGRLTPVFPKGLPALLIRKGNELYALENRCRHMGCPLAAGTLDGYTLQCPCHDWSFDIRDGSLLAAPEIKLKLYPAEVRGGKVFLRIS